MGEVEGRARGSSRFIGSRHCLMLTAVVSIIGVYGSAGAFEIPTGSEDVQLRWDNTLRYNLASRIDEKKGKIINNPNTDDGDRNFDVGIVSNRLDILSEADLVYKKDYGVRVSGAGWYDQQYHNHLDNKSIATSNHLSGTTPVIGLNSYNEEHFAGPNGELLDAFTFGKFEIADMPVNIKVGRHTVFWGEGLLLGGTVHGISYAQSPLDGAKVFAVPGIEAKELFRPLNNISFQIQPTEQLSVMGQYFLEWESNTFPEAGTFLGLSDVMMNGSESLILGPGLRAVRGHDIEPHSAGDWGLAARWAPEAIDGTLGLYYRNLSDRFPQVHLTVGAPVNGILGNYKLAYVDNIDLYGVSYSTQILGVSIGTEFSYRHNMPLISDPVVNKPLPSRGETNGARGNTLHAVVNFLGLINKTPIFDSATWNMEYVWSRWDRVTQGEQYFQGRDGYHEINKITKDYVGGAVGFTPTWYHVLPGVDIITPMSVSCGLIGNSAVTLGGNKNGGAFAVGVGADIFNKYKVDLKYTDFFGEFGSNQAKPGGLPVNNGPFALLSDRGYVSLTLKTTF